MCLADIYGRFREIPKALAVERQLFPNGTVYKFDIGAETKQLQNVVRGYEGSDKTELDNLDRYMEKVMRGQEWRMMFNGRMPSEWGSRLALEDKETIGNTFNKAEEMGAQLSSDLLLAAVLHPEENAAGNVLSQKLPPDLLGIVLFRTYHKQLSEGKVFGELMGEPYWEMVDGQVRAGGSREDFNEATKFATSLNEISWIKNNPHKPTAYLPLLSKYFNQE